MENISFSNFRVNLAATLDRVNSDHIPILVTRQSGTAAVIISLKDFQSYEETAYLMSSPKNAERINRSIEELENKKGKTRRLIEA